MNEDKKILVNHYADGTSSVLRKTVVYTELRFYQRSDVLYQLTRIFCQRFLPKYGDRTVDQMIQAARSTKQNIAEGSTRNHNLLIFTMQKYNFFMTYANKNTIFCGFNHKK